MRSNVSDRVDTVENKKRPILTISDNEREHGAIVASNIIGMVYTPNSAFNESYHRYILSQSYDKIGRYTDIIHTNAHRDTAALAVTMSDMYVKGILSLNPASDLVATISDITENGLHWTHVAAMAPWAIAGASHIKDVHFRVNGQAVSYGKAAANLTTEERALLDATLRESQESAEVCHSLQTLMRAGMKKTNAAGLTKDLKGLLAEARTSYTMQRAGYTELPGRLPGNRGFDGIWVKYAADKTTITEVVITESKYAQDGVFVLADTATMGKQMSNQWINANITKMQNAAAREVRDTGRILRDIWDNNRIILTKRGACLDPQGILSCDVLQ
jgi:hypothetical protein